MSQLLIISTMCRGQILLKKSSSQMINDLIFAEFNQTGKNKLLARQL